MFQCEISCGLGKEWLKLSWDTPLVWWQGHCLFGFVLYSSVELQGVIHLLCDRGIQPFHTISCDIVLHFL